MQWLTLDGIESREAVEWSVCMITTPSMQATSLAASSDSPPQCKIYTPFPLARAITNAVGDHAGAAWLEPSHGQGAFLRALADMRVPRERIRAIDLDGKASV